jgi:hypothetical protein
MPAITIDNAGRMWKDPPVGDEGMGFLPLLVGAATAVASVVKAVKKPKKKSVAAPTPVAAPAAAEGSGGKDKTMLYAGGAFLLVALALATRR